MKKLIAVLLVFVMVLSVAACGKKSENKGNEPPVSNGSSDTQPNEEKTPAQDNTAPSGEAGQESTAPAQDATTPSEDANKVDTVVKPSEENTPSKDEDDIKVEINTDGTAKDPVVTPSDKAPENSFVINFDDLLEASKK